MRGAFSAGSCLLLLALGCSGATTRNPPGEADEGAAGGSGADQSSECGCLVDEIAWWRDGGLVPSQSEGHLIPCARFEYAETNELGERRFCSATLQTCTDEYDTDEVNRALAHPDVQAALERSPVLFGADPRALDGHVDHIEVGGKIIELGDPCDPNELGPDCVIPQGVENFGTLLGFLQFQQLVDAPCEVNL